MKNVPFYFNTLVSDRFFGTNNFIMCPFTIISDAAFTFHNKPYLGQEIFVTGKVAPTL